MLLLSGVTLFCFEAGQAASFCQELYRLGRGSGVRTLCILFLRRPLNLEVPDAPCGV